MPWRWSSSTGLHLYKACLHNLSTTAFVREPAPHLAGSIVPTGAAPSLYSDVAASRPLSPVKETIPLRPTESAVREEATIVPHPTESTVDVISTNDYEKLEHDTSSDLSNWSKRQDNAPWITVECRCARSLSSLERAQKDRERFLTLKLNCEQKQTIHAATNTLTTKERQRILRHHEKMVAHRDSSLSSRGEGPSRLKGKAIDPREWGNMNISQESLDLGAQLLPLSHSNNRWTHQWGMEVWTGEINTDQLFDQLNLNQLPKSLPTAILGLPWGILTSSQAKLATWRASLLPRHPAVNCLTWTASPDWDMTPVSPLILLLSMGPIGARITGMVPTGPNIARPLVMSPSSQYPWKSMMAPWMPEHTIILSVKVQPICEMGTWGDIRRFSCSCTTWLEKPMTFTLKRCPWMKTNGCYLNSIQNYSIIVF